MYIINLFIASTIYLIGITFGLYLSGYTYKQLTHEEIEKENIKEESMIHHMKLLNFQYLYEDELRDLSLNSYDKENLKIVELEVPLNYIIMYYDHVNDSFCYYTKNGDVGYKYLNVVCRKFVIDNNCKELYKEGFEPIEDTEEILIDSCFSKKNKDKPNKIKSKIINRFICMGTYEDYYETKKVVPKNNLSFMDYFSNK
jgi:hypothetical protein|tara:strand:+ start:551 stop:1147 length:597 start_codon:yes stop_codon:yes gene_type:complete